MELQEIYKKGTHQQLWDKGWDTVQRTHFLIDHYDMYVSDLESDVNKYAQKFSHSSWKDLPVPIKKQVAVHHAMGFYGEGGKIKSPMKYLPLNKKKLLSQVTSIKERMGKVKDDQTLAALNDHIQKLEAILNAPKTPTQQKVAKWKDGKTEKRLNRTTV